MYLFSLPFVGRKSFIPLAMVLLMFSCSQESIEPRLNHSYDTSDIETLLTELPKGGGFVQPIFPELEEGLLTFKDISHFHQTADFLSHLTREELDEWELELGFNSMRYYFDLANDEYSEIQDLTQLDLLKDKYESKVKFGEDGTIELPFELYYYASILAPDGTVRVGESLQSYLGDRIIIIIDGDQNKLSHARRMTVSDVEQGIIIIDKEVITLVDESRFSRTGGTNYEEATEPSSTSNGTRRLKIIANLHVWTQPLYIANLIPDPEGRWINFWRVITRAQSHEKKWWGWKKRDSDFRETFSYTLTGNNTYSTESYPMQVTTDTWQSETYWNEWETIQYSALSACFTAIDYDVEGEDNNGSGGSIWETASILYP